MDQQVIKMGKYLIVAGIILIVVGLILQFSIKIPFLGRLPGDIRVEKENFKFYFPITSSILISLLLSIILYLINRSKQ